MVKTVIFPLTGYSKIMVGMGYNSAGYLKDIEIIDLVRLIN
jgi:hypothetical protein